MIDDVGMWRAANAIDVTNHLLVVLPAEPGFQPEWASSDRVGALLLVADRAVAVLTGVWGGPVDVEVELLDGPPAGVDERRAWEAVEEVTIRPRAGAMTVGPLMDEALPPFDRVPLLTGQSRCARVRAHARGRATEFDGVVDQPVERHLVQIWAEEAPRDALVMREDDQWALQGAPTTAD